MSGSKTSIVKMSASAIALLLSASFALAHQQIEELHNSIGMVFVRIPAGEFMMGSEGWWYWERPVHRVQISQPFYLGKYEVTQGQWQALMGSNPSRFTDDPNRPVEQVSWHDVQEFIKRLNDREALGKIYRLPTEAEWEYAARASTTTDYHFGNDASELEKYAWYRENNPNLDNHEYFPVGQLLPNPWGLHDMYGNVWEWVQDWYADYLEGDVTDPTGPSSSSWRPPSRIIRGGSSYNSAGDCRSSIRGYDTPGSPRFNHGFRLVRIAE